MALPLPSAEQQAVIDAADCNILINAVAGSGKTSTVLHLAQALAPARVLCLTYNRNLRDDSVEKMRQVGVQNLDVYTFHSFCRAFYQMTGYTDSDVLLLLQRGNALRPPTKEPYALIVLDEAQDLKPLYYQLFLKYYADACAPAGPAAGPAAGKAAAAAARRFFEPRRAAAMRIVVMGDVRQSIYQFNGTDSRYLEYADIFFAVNSFPWKRMHLTTSYRMTPPMATFLNDDCLQCARLAPGKAAGPPVQYIHYNKFKNKLVVDQIAELHREGIPYHQMLILIPSLAQQKKNKPLQSLVNELSARGICIFLPSNDMDFDRREMDKKLSILTFHRAKGIERRAVLVLNFDASYFQYYSSKDPTACSNELYVALTRSTERLLLFHHFQSPPFAFLRDYRSDSDHVQYSFAPHLLKRLDKQSEPPAPAEVPRRSIFITELYRYVDNETMAAIQRLANFKLLCPEREPIKLSTLLELADGTFESISDLLGQAIIMHYEFRTTKRVRAFDEAKISYKDLSDRGALFRALLQYHRTSTGLHHRAAQLSKRLAPRRSKTSTDNPESKTESRAEWITQAALEATFRRLQGLRIDRAAQFEMQVVHYEVDIDYEVRGMADCIDHEARVVYEFKFTQSLTFEHQLQLLLYRHFLVQAFGQQMRDYAYILYNVRTEEKLQLDIQDDDTLQQAVRLLYRAKFKQDAQSKDSAFFQDNLQLVRRHGLSLQPTALAHARTLFE